VADGGVCPCLWIGTSLGSLLIVAFGLPADNARNSDPVSVMPSGTYDNYFCFFGAKCPHCGGSIDQYMWFTTCQKPAVHLLVLTASVWQRCLLGVRKMDIRHVKMRSSDRTCPSVIWKFFSASWE